MTDKKRQPSVAQSLEIIFEVACENKAQLIRHSALQKEIYELLKKQCEISRISIPSDREKLVQEIKAGFTKISTTHESSQAESRKLALDMVAAGKSLTTYFLCCVFATLMLGAAAYKVYELDKDLEHEIESSSAMRSGFLKFLKDEKLEKKYGKWKESMEK